MQDIGSNGYQRTVQEYNDKIPTVCIRYLDEKRPSCPNCWCGGDYVVIHKKDVPTKSYDLENGKPALIVTYRKRYRCKKCGKTFFGSQSVGKKPYVSADFSANLAEEMLTNPGETFSSLSRRYQIGRTTITEEIKRRFYADSEAILYVVPCNRLFFCPVDYEGSVRCVIIGCDVVTNKNRLIWMLSAYKADEIEAFINDYVTEPSQVDSIFCSPDRSIVSLLKERFCNATVGILDECVNKLIDSLKVDTLDGRFNEKCKALDNFSKMLHRSSSAEFIKNYDAWWDSLDDPLKAAFGALNDSVCSFPDQWSNYTDYTKTELDCAEFFDLIYRLRKKNVPFEIMRYRVMFSFKDLSVYGKDDDVTIIKVISGFYLFDDGGLLPNYGVALTDIIKLDLK